MGDREAIWTLQHAVLVACRTRGSRDLAGTEPVGTITQADYRRITAGAQADIRTQICGWLGEVGIDVEVPAERQALYHHEPGRQYRPTRRELDSGRFECPACHIILVRVTRKAKDPLYRCRDCAWSIARSDIFDPAIGEPPQLRDDVEYPEGIAPDPKDETGPW